jgi:predicted Ser/Thr protein kinase
MGDYDAVAIEENWNISFPDIRLGDLIGKGSFGSVYKSRFSGIDVAVKHIRSVYGQAGEFEHEVAMLRFESPHFCLSF